MNHLWVYTECAYDGCGRKFMRQSSQHRFCSKKCRHKATYTKKMDTMVCLLCGETIKRTGPRQKYCMTRCEPARDLVIKCSCCEEEKPYSEFHDYRGVHPDGKFRPSCKRCTSAGVRNRQLEKEKSNET